MPNAPTASVIMPVYNSREYLADAVASVLEQDFGDFELILVDDGSTDGSAQSCDALAASDARVRVYHIPNGGMCHARNFGLDRARGTYVAFCDNDDRYLPGLLSHNVRILRSSGADCVRFGRRLMIYDEVGAKPRTSDLMPRTTDVYGSRERMVERFDEVRSGSDAVWACLYRRQVIVDGGLRFDERLRHGWEDVLFNLAFLRHATSVATNAGVYYCWLRRSSHSSSFDVSSDFPDDFRLGFEQVVRQEDALMREWGIDRSMPAHYGAKMAGYLMDPLATLILRGLGPYASVRPALVWLADLFRPYARTASQVPGIPQRTFFRLVVCRRFALAYACMRLARHYLALTGR